ncbi:filamentous hemagglutinin N-terminal domain-containing protein [Paraburkholderia sacchari]|uniref:filamentous hemagglutinin N-terminal domain-containing protein n=1 Tax=Paraburkholderia sacchari TaxID=159450 RepID=UPI003D955078
MAALSTQRVSEPHAHHARADHRSRLTGPLPLNKATRGIRKIISMTNQNRSASITGHAGTSLWFAARASAFAALCAFGMQPLVASAQATLPIAADPGAAARATLDVSGNGTQVVNIVAPNAAGVSNNRFSQFNVGTSGVILNNATQNVQTQIGGSVQANAALGGKNANLVLMQVTGRQASQLLGTTEVAGKGANLVLANPAGITCSGCGFLNAPRVTFATGTPTLNADGSLGAIDVKQGTISVQGNGLNSASSAVDLIARAISVNAQVRGKTIDAIAGANRVDYASKNATAQVGTGERPQVAIDVQSLGSMYGDGAVRMIGTEAGVGVRDNGALTSLTGGFEHRGERRRDDWRACAREGRRRRRYPGCEREQQRRDCSRPGHAHRRAKFADEQRHDRCGTRPHAGRRPPEPRGRQRQGRDGVAWRRERKQQGRDGQREPVSLSQRTAYRQRGDAELGRRREHPCERHLRQCQGHSPHAEQRAVRWRHARQ